MRALWHSVANFLHKTQLTQLEAYIFKTYFQEEYIILHRFIFYLLHKLLVSKIQICLMKAKAPCYYKYLTALQYLKHKYS